MKRFLQRILLLAIPIGIAFGAHADIGKTYELKQKRNLLLQQMQTLESDVIVGSNGEETTLLSDQIIALDNKLLESYEQTIHRITSQKKQDLISNKWLMLLSLFAFCIAAFSTVLIFLARHRIVSKKNVGILEVYEQLFADIFEKTSPENADKPQKIRVHLVVIVGIVMMGISIVAHLVGKI